jgi:transposase-like protein
LLVRGLLQLGFDGIEFRQVLFQQGELVRQALDFGFGKIAKLLTIRCSQCCQIALDTGFDFGYVTVKCGIFILSYRQTIYIGIQGEIIMKSSEFMQLLTAIRGLDHPQRKRLSAALNKPSDPIKVFERIEARFDAQRACPHCAGVELYRHGVVSGLQRHYCKPCHKTFNALTGTPLARLRDKPKWLDHLATMARSQTVRQSAADTGVHRNTSFRWRHRFLNWISQDRPATLHGITEADETYVFEACKGQRNLGRKARKRGGHATQRGISDEQIGVRVARDRSGQTLDFVTGNGPLTRPLLTAALKPVLDVDALLVSEANPTYTAYCQAEGISHEVVNLSQGQRVNGAYHAQNVNAYHSRFKLWLERFPGVATHYLPNYLGWRRAFEQHRQLVPETLLNAALGNFQYLTVT